MSDGRVPSQDVSPEASRLGIVIVNYNTSEQTRECLASVLAESPTGTTIVVVDNGSRDDSVAAIGRDFPSVHVIDAGENLGFAAGVNRGAAALDTDYVLLLNPDTIVLPGSLDALVSFAEQNPGYGLFGGRTLRADGTLEPSSCWGAPSLWSLTSFALGLSTAFSGSTLFDPESLGTWQRDTVREVPIITGCLLLVRGDDWQRLGGMDERFFLYGEDAEFSLRAKRRGLASVIVPDAQIVHEVGGSTASSGTKMCMVMAGKATLLRTSWSPASARIGIALLQAGAATRTLLEAAARRRTRTWTTVWQRRADWRTGYPAARAALFPAQPMEAAR